MREKIITKAAELFLNLGFKSITMDDIANEMGISKKTIYVHFANKTQLVEAVTLTVFEIICDGIDIIRAAEKNPIEELYDIKNFVMTHLKDEKSSPQHQLQKYYPKIYASLKKKQFDIMQECVVNNLNKGIKQGLFRKTISVEFIARMYFNATMCIKDKELFPLQKFSMNMLMEHYLEYHLRGITTEKGIEVLNQIININQSK